MARDAVVQTPGFVITSLPVIPKAHDTQRCRPSTNPQARPMLELIWAPLLGAFSLLFEEYADPRWGRGGRGPTPPGVHRIC